MSPYVLGGGITAALLLAIAAFFYGQHVGALDERADWQAAIKKAEKQRDDAIATAQRADARAYAAEQNRQTIVREITREVPKIIDRPVYAAPCADGDGRLLIEKGIAAANGRGAPSGGPDGEAAGNSQPPR